jgi:hypothetical protein
MWGTYWTWDARLTSELVLLFLYLGVIGLYHAIEDRRQAARAASFLALIGIVNVPIVHFSVNWWNTLHQGSTVRLMGESHITGAMVWPLLVMALATPLLSLIGAVCVALTVGMRRSGMLLALLVLPLYVPVLIFGAGACNAAQAGFPFLAPLLWLGAGLVLALVLAPLACAAALKISLS